MEHKSYSPIKNAVKWFNGSYLCHIKEVKNSVNFKWMEAASSLK